MTFGETYGDRILPVTESGCHIWLAATNEKGYGIVRWHGKQWRAHRAAWADSYGDPGELCVCHKCDNPSCVNPAHLFLGTNEQNIHDKVAKGRAICRSRQWL